MYGIAPGYAASITELEFARMAVLFAPSEY
jgi:hypothetical protein